MCPASSRSCAHQPPSCLSTKPRNLHSVPKSSFISLCSQSLGGCPQGHCVHHSAPGPDSCPSPLISPGSQPNTQGPGLWPKGQSCSPRAPRTRPALGPWSSGSGGSYRPTCLHSHGLPSTLCPSLGAPGILFSGQSGLSKCESGGPLPCQSHEHLTQLSKALQGQTLTEAAGGGVSSCPGQPRPMGAPSSHIPHPRDDSSSPTLSWSPRGPPVAWRSIPCGKNLLVALLTTPSL